MHQNNNILFAKNFNRYLNLITLINDVVNVIHFTGYFKQFGSGDVTGIYCGTTRAAIKTKSGKIRF